MKDAWGKWGEDEMRKISPVVISELLGGVKNICHFVSFSLGGAFFGG